MPLALSEISVVGLGSDSKDAALACAFSPGGERCCVSVGSHVEQFTHDGSTAGRSINGAACGGKYLKDPVVSLAFRPEGAASKLKNTLAIGCSDGSLLYWHLGSHKVIASAEEVGNEIYSVEFTTGGSALTTAGKDSKVRVYDPDTLKCTAVLSEGAIGAASHTSRIQCLSAVSENCVLSGGWDNLMCLWDIRAPKSVSTIYGPYICGDAISVYGGNTVLTCSARNEKQIQLWDLRGGGATPFAEKSILPSEGTSVAHLYSGGFSPSGKEVVVGGINLLHTYSIAPNAPPVEVPIQGTHCGSIFSISKFDSKFLGCGTHCYFGSWL